MRVLFFSPGFPAEMPDFVRGLSQLGAEVVGLGDQPAATLPPRVRGYLSDYVQANSLWDRDSLEKQIDALHQRQPFDRIECLWEPGMLLAGQLRDTFGIPGLSEQQTIPFRDKGCMKQVLDDAGIRTPRYRRANGAEEVQAACEAVGYPVCVKPIAGAGSADTHRVDDAKQLEEILPTLQHVEELSVEEFIEGEEYTFDTICADGEILYFSVSWYRPRPLIARTVEWMSPQTVALRQGDSLPALSAGRRMGAAVIEALGFQTGFTHMEWFLTDDGEAIFGEIAARPPGARSVDIMNYSGDIDVFVGWAEAVCHGRCTQPIEKPYNAAVVFKRAEGSGRIQSIEGLQELLSKYPQQVASIDLLPVGSHRRNWKQTLLSDGSVVVRHPDLTTTLEIADDFGTRLRLLAE